jgi:hypothetical protein
LRLIENMDNAAKYHFSDFVYEEYRQLLKLAKKNYTFRGYTDFQKNEKFVIWRHDIDFNPEYAVKLAEIEANENVRATYFILLHSNLYNLLSVDNKNYIIQIMNYGHTIGLHFDSSYYNIINENDLENYLLFEKNILEKTFGQTIDSFSFHINTDFTMQCEAWQYAGLINTYSTYFKKEVGYCSDSYGYWKFRRLKDVLTEATDERLHILTHPEWWQETAKSPKQRLTDCVNLQAAKMLQGDSEVLKARQREHEYIDWQ